MICFEPNCSGAATLEWEGKNKMGKIHSKYVCQTCAYESPRWVGKCPNCGGWNTFVEELSQKVSARKLVKETSIKAIPMMEVDSVRDQRIASSIAEFDRVLGGGI